MWNPFKKKDSTQGGAQSASAPAPTTAPAPAPAPSSGIGTDSAGEGIKAPVAGRLISLDEVPDPVFAQRMLGEGFAVDPTGTVVCAPVDGQIMMIAPTSHAFAIRTPLGAEILVHIGLDTVNLQGAGFTVRAMDGQQVRCGEPVIEVDWDQVKGEVPAILTPVVLTNAGDFQVSKVNLNAGDDEDVMRLRAKQ